MMQHSQNCLSLALCHAVYMAIFNCTFLTQHTMLCSPLQYTKNPHLLFNAVLPPHTFGCCTGCTKCTRSKPCAVFDAITAGEGAACNSEQTGTHRASSGGAVHLHGMRYPTEEPCGVHPMWAHLLLRLLDEGEGWRRARLS